MWKQEVGSRQSRIASQQMKSQKVIVGLSGGVDSSVAAYLLLQQGCEVEAMFMQNWHDTTGTLHGDCPWKDDLTVAKLVAKQFGIPFHFIDLSAEYRKKVVDYMFAEYERGRTPNPDVLCNREIKFDVFFESLRGFGSGLRCHRALLPQGNNRCKRRGNSPPVGRQRPEQRPKLLFVPALAAATQQGAVSHWTLAEA